MKGMIAILLAGALLPGAAVADEWKSYTYTDPGFTIQFPGVPAVERSRVKNASGATVTMTRYAVRQERVNYTLSVVNYSSTNADALSTIKETERSLGATGKVTAAGGARINRHFGRELRLNGTDGSHSAVAIYFVNNHLYTVISQALPPNATLEESGDAGRFQKSLQFADDGGGFGSFFGGLFNSDSGDHAKGGDSGAHANGGDSSDTAKVGDGGDHAKRGDPDAHAKAASNPHTDASCAGRSAGDAVQLDSPSGPVAATCTLVARPDVAPRAQGAAAVR